MHTGRSLADVSQQITDEQKWKRDFLVDTPLLNVTPEGNISFGVNGDRLNLRPTNHCLRQIAERTGIPAKYAERMQTEAPALLATNINHWFQAKPERRLVRTLVNGQQTARAFLSDGYRPLDNFDLVAAVMPKLAAAGCEIKSCEVTETRLYLQAVTPRLEAVIQQEVKHGDHTRLEPRPVQAGVCIGNSEVGMGQVFIDPLVYDLVCRNGLIVARSLGRRHIGRKLGNGNGNEDDVYELLSDKTKELSDAAFWNAIRDVADAALNAVRFNESVDKLRAAQGQKVEGKPKEIVERVAERFTMPDSEAEALFEHLVAGGDLSMFGLANALTSVANTVTDYDRAVELERVGGQVIELSPRDFSTN